MGQAKPSTSGSATDFDSLAENSIPEGELKHEELLALNPFALPSFSRRKVRYMAAFDVEKWAAEFGRSTFATASAPVLWEEGLAIQHIFQEGCCGHHGKVTEGDVRALGGLHEKLRALFGRLEHRGSGGAFFVRLGPRSPKDAPMAASEPWGLSRTKLQEALWEALAGPLAALGRGAPAEAHELLRCFQRACGSLLRVTVAEEAVALLVSSCRVMQDVSRTLDHGRAGWDVSVSARAWDPEVSLEREFRAFVVGGMATAVTQYDDQLRYESIVENPESIMAAIQCGLEEVQPAMRRLGLASASSAVVVDLLVVPGSGPADPWSARVVELNPFGPMTGSALFGWDTERRLLQGGRDLYGDLDEWETHHLPGHKTPQHVAELSAGGVPFRFLVDNSPSISWEYLEAFWGDYLALAPADLVGPSTRS